MAIKKFYRGSATYKCNVCGRSTRDVGDNGCSKLCPQCFDLAGIENEVSDGYYSRDEALAKVTPLVAEVAVRGGDVSTWNETFSLSAVRS